MQKPCPADVNGVPVKIFVTGSDGNTLELATVTSDANACFITNGRQLKWVHIQLPQYSKAPTHTGHQRIYRLAVDTASTVVIPTPTTLT